MCGDGDDARRLFDEMTERDQVAWYVLICYFCRDHQPRDAFAVTCLLPLRACAHKTWAHLVFGCGYVRKSRNVALMKP